MNYINPSPIKAAITAVGAYVPEEKLTNAELEKMVDTNDDWIVVRTGIKERRILKDSSKGTSFMAIKAAEDLLRKRNLDPKEINQYSQEACDILNIKLEFKKAYVACD